MYEELVKRLRDEANEWCTNCCYKQGNCPCAAPDDRKKDCDIYTKLQAADAIEKLGDWWAMADKLMKMLEMPRWISMKERLPEENAPCIVYNKDYGPMVGWRVDGERFRIPGSHFPDHPTHWMPIPEPPKELTGTDMRGGIRRDDAGNVIDWGITGPPGDVGKTEEGE